MAPLDPNLMAMMRARAQAVKEKLAGSGGGDWLPRWDLTGKSAVVEAGRELVIRVLPRWDFAQKWIAGGKPNPEYKNGPIFFEAIEHWHTSPDGKRHRSWCPKIWGADEACPIHEAWEELRVSKAAADKELAKDLKPTDVYLFNALIATPTGSWAVDDAGLADIRYMPCPGTIFLGIINIMTGGENEEFARGDISDPREGYNLKLSRPAGQGDRWKVDCMPKPSPLATDVQKAAFAKWWERLADLPAMVERETKSYDDLYKAFHGVAPPVGQSAPATAPLRPAEGSDMPGGTGEPPEDPFGDLGGPGDIEMPGGPVATAVPPRPIQGPRRPGRR